VHDGCGIVMPHAYDAGPDAEVAQFHEARGVGVDGLAPHRYATGGPPGLVLGCGALAEPAIRRGVGLLASAAR
jgi:hypothetical protein